MSTTSEISTASEMPATLEIPTASEEVLVTPLKVLPTTNKPTKLVGSFNWATLVKSTISAPFVPEVVPEVVPQSNVEEIWEVKKSNKSEDKSADKINLSALVKTAMSTKTEKDKGYTQAFNQAVKEAKLSMKEISDIWSEYSYIVEPRTGRPYNCIPLNLPRKTTYVETYWEDNKEKKSRYTNEDPDNFTVDNCTHEFSRAEFYANRDFQWEVKQHYRQLGYSIGFYSGYSGYIMKIFMK